MIHLACFVGIYLYLAFLHHKLNLIFMKAAEAVTALQSLAEQQKAQAVQVDKILAEEKTLQDQIAALQAAAANADLPQSVTDAIASVVNQGSTLGAEIQKLDDNVPDAPAAAPSQTQG
jgi:hypothetical protein